MSGETLPPPTPHDSLVYKLRFTPLRDVLRGRLTARMDLKRLIAQSGLPGALQELIGTTVRKTRLRWYEKTDVTRELISHFHDGSDSGQTPEHLVQQFGDIALAAKLIRRARKRNRSIFYRATVKSLKYAALLAAVTYVLLFVRFYSGSVRLTRNFLKEMNAPILATPEEDRAWPIYRRAFLATTPWPNEAGSNAESPSSPGWPALLKYIASNQEAMRHYREAAAKPALGMVVSTNPDLEVQRHNQEFPDRFEPPPPDESDNPPVIGILFPNLHVMRFGSRLLRVDALESAQRGDGARVLADITAMLAMADQCTQQTPLIADLVSIAILAQAADVMGEILSRNPAVLDDAGWIGLSHRLAAVRGGGAFRARLDGERVCFDDFVQRYYTDDGDGDGHLRPSQDAQLIFGLAAGEATMGPSHVTGPIVSAFVAGRSDLLAKYGELMARVESEAQTPLWQRDASSADLVLEQLSSNPVQKARYWYIALLFPSLSRANYLFEVTTQQRDATLVAIALEIYHRKHGAFPPTLDVLVPQYLPAVPPDRYDGQPIKYKLIDGRPLLYSVGVNRVDDGGILPAAKSRTQANTDARNWIAPSALPTNPLEIEKLRGDWILWPPVED